MVVVLKISGNIFFCNLSSWTITLLRRKFCRDFDDHKKVEYKILSLEIGAVSSSYAAFVAVMFRSICEAKNESTYRFEFR
mmetsp:Transcript_3402/g.4283  ORF Transcript_3402/g.4283 Transcript_3402/m.4283 type:complete len:80 (+) Transcript_3402:615-854(+)